MRNPSVPVLTLSLLTAAALAGCSAADVTPDVTPGPDPTPSATVALCDPAADGTDIAWQPKVEKDRSPVGHRVVTVDAAGEQTHVDTHDDYVTTVSGLPDVETDEAFIDSLVADFERTGQTTSDHFGDPSPDFDSVSVSDIPAGDYVIGYTVTQVGATFTLSCPGVQGEQTAELVTSEGDEVGGTLVGCSDDRTVARDAYSDSLLAYCPPA